MWCAVSADARIDVNVALNRPSYQSSSYLEYHAYYGNDGNSDSSIYNHGCVHTNDVGTNPWWAVDLGAALYVEGVKFTNREESGTYAIS